MDIQRRKKLITNGNMYKALITLAIPIMINNFIQCLYNLADSIWVGKLGSVEFAATAFVWPVDFLFISIGTGISIAGTALLAQLIGSNRTKETKEYTTQLFAISILSAVIFTMVGVVISPIIVTLMGASGDFASFSTVYLRITFLSLPFTFMYFIFNSIMVSQGNTVVPTFLSGISAVINIILDPIFIFNFNLGVAGAAYATLASKFILCIMAYLILKGSSSPLKPCFKNFKFNKQITKEIIKIALPSSIGQSGSALGFMVLNGFIASYGTSTLAAFGMVNRITSLICQPAMGFGSALVTITGQNLGSSQLNRVKEGFKKALTITIIITAIGSLFMYIFNIEIIQIFMQAEDDYKVIDEGLTYLNYILFSMPLMGMFSILQGVFQGSGYTKYSMSMEVGRLWFVRLPMILIFKYITSVGSVGIWFSMSFSNLIICIYGYIIYKQGNWQKNKLSLD